MNRATHIILLVAPALLVGCHNDNALHLAPGDAPLIEGVPNAGPNAPDGPHWPDGPGDPDRPPPFGDPPDGPPGWGGWDPGDIPDLYFAVAYSEWDCNGDVDGLGADEPDGLPDDPGEDEPPDNDSVIDEDGDGWYGCPIRIAVIDLLGQVIAEFPLPGEEATWTPNFHLALSPAGPGQFLATVERYDDVVGDGDEDGSNADGFWQSTWWHSYRGDAFTGDLDLVAEWAPNEGKMSLPTAGRLVDIGGYDGWANLAISPAAPDRLMVWTGGSNCGGLRELRSIYLPDGNVLDDVYLPEDLLPPDFPLEAATLWPWNLDAGVDEAGQTSLLLGVSTSWCYDVEAAFEMVAWNADEGPTWTAPAMGQSWPPSASWAGHAGGAAVEVSGGVWSMEQTWRVSTPAATAEGIFPVDSTIFGRRIGPMFDGAGPTFMTSTRQLDATQYRDILEIHHEGDVVWTIDTLRFGLQERSVFIADVVLLPSLPTP